MKEDKIETTSAGGKQSEISGMPTLIPPHAMKAVSATMRRGSKYGVDNWHYIPVMAEKAGSDPAGNAIVDSGELDHALQHYLNFRTKTGDPLEELTHMAARSLMALDQYIRENNIDLERFKG